MATTGTSETADTAGPSTSSTPAVPPAARQHSHTDNFFAPPLYHGRSDENAEDFVRYFERYAAYKNMNEVEQLQFISVLLRDAASDHFDALTDNQRDTWAHFKEAFLARFGRTQSLLWKDAADLWSMQQGGNEPVEDFIAKVTRKARYLPNIDESTLRFAILRGVKQHVRTHVLQSNPQSMSELLQAAKVADASQTSPADQTQLLLDELKSSNQQHASHRAAFEEISSRLNQLQISTMDGSRSDRRNRSNSPRRVRFADGPRGTSPDTERRQNFQPQHRSYQTTDRQRLRSRPSNVTPGNCYRCGTFHRNQTCIAAQARCTYCHKIGHYASVCFQKQRNNSGSNRY